MKNNLQKWKMSASSRFMNLLKVLPLAVFIAITSCSKDDPDPISESENTNVIAFATASGQIIPNSVSANGDDGNIPANTLDGDLGTRWSSQGYSGKYITYDLGSTQTVSRLKIAWYKGDQRKAYFKIRAGNSTSTLSNVYDAKTTGSSGATTQLETYDFTPVSARYIRVSCFGNSSNAWNSITETEIYGTSDGSGEPIFPYDKGLTRWKVTLPRNFSGRKKDGKLVADEVFIDQSKNHYSGDPSFKTYSDEYFFVTNDDNVRFECPATSDVPTTSAGTTNTRTELREMPANGDGENGWDANGSTLRTLEFRVRIMQTPKSKKLAFAQIHDFGQAAWDDLLRVQIESNVENAQVGDTGTIYLLGDLIEEDNSGGGFPTNFRAKNYADRKLKTDYRLGDWISMKVTVQNATVRVYLNDMNTPVRTYTQASSASNYFKAGVYNQSISSNYGGSGIAEFSSITVSDNF